MELVKEVTRCWMAVFLLGLLLRSSQAISVSPNSYELTIAISEDSINISPEERLPLLESLKTTMTTTSQLLFEATEYYLYFKKINIVVPRTWLDVLTTGVTATSTHNYLNADIRIETTMESQTKLVEEPRTYNSKGCGQPGEYIIVPAYFFNQSAGNLFGDKAKVMLHQFANYRYGVHDEHGFVTEGDKFPYTFMNPRGFMQITGCNNSEIDGSYLDSEGKVCSYPDSVDCRFRPNMAATTGPTTSLMFMQFAPTVTKFCDSSNHDRTAPNKQNYWCRNRSVKTVMRQSTDFRRINALPSSTVTTPEYSYLVRASQAVYIVLDASTHTLTDDTVFNYIKNQISTSLINQLASASTRSYVGIAVMGGSSINETDGRLGGYIKEIQSPIQVQNNQQTLINKINTLTRSSGSGLLLDKAVLDIGDQMTNFTQLSGSIVLLVKLNDITQPETMNVEVDAVNLLNSRNSRLVTFEYNVDSVNNVLQRTTELTGGSYYTAGANYETIFPQAIGRTLELVQETKFRSPRVQLVRDAFTATSTTPSRGYYTIDYKSVDMEINFFVFNQPPRPSDYAIVVNGPGGNIFTLGSTEHRQRYSSWDRKYKIHTFSFKASGATGVTYTFSVTTTGIPMSGYFEAIEILDQNAPNYIGGGGLPADRLVEVEVRTSGDNGVLNMGASTEDTSFLIYAAARKGYYVARSFYNSKAIVHGPNGIQEVALRDNGLYPDFLAGDGIFSGFYRPPRTTSTVTYRVSVILDGYRRNNPLPSYYNEDERLLPTDQGNYCCGSVFTLPATAATFMRYYPYVTSLQAMSSNFYTERPVRITDFRIESFDLDSVTFSWTAPQESYGQNVSVVSYRLVYGNSPSDIITTEGGVIPPTANFFTTEEVLDGSLIPATPYQRQTVTVLLDRNETTPQPFYFTIASNRTTGTTWTESYPAPMVYINGTELITTTPPPSTTTTAPSTTRASTTTTSPTTKAPTTARTTVTTTQASTTSKPSVPTVPTTDEPSAAQGISSSLFLFSIVSILAVVF